MRECASSKRQDEGREMDLLRSTRVLGVMAAAACGPSARSAPAVQRQLPEPSATVTQKGWPSTVTVTVAPEMMSRSCEVPPDFASATRSTPT